MAFQWDIATSEFIAPGRLTCLRINYLATVSASIDLSRENSLYVAGIQIWLESLQYLKYAEWETVALVPACRRLARCAQHASWMVYQQLRYLDTLSMISPGPARDLHCPGDCDRDDGGGMGRRPSAQSTSHSRLQSLVDTRAGKSSPSARLHDHQDTRWSWAPPTNTRIREECARRH
jgi:hypothetical protein